MNPTTKTSTLIGILILLSIAAALLMQISSKAKEHRLLSIDTFEECALAGYPIMESYPEQCRTPDGRTFTNEEQKLVPPSQTGVGIISAGGCEVGGCSAQLCGEAGSELMSTCEYRAEYACYQKHSSCERQPNGKCGWTPNAALSRCLANPQTKSGMPEPGLEVY